MHTHKHRIHTHLQVLRRFILGDTSPPSPGLPSQELVTATMLAATSRAVQVFLQHTAKHCRILQHTATYCNIMRYTATQCNAPQRTATHCKALEQTVVQCNALQRTAAHCNTLQHTATLLAATSARSAGVYLHNNLLQHTAT